MPKRPADLRSERINIRLSPKVKALLERLATAEGRTISSYCERLISAHVAVERSR